MKSKFQHANQLLKEKRYSEAVAEYEKLILSGDPTQKKYIEFNLALAKKYLITFPGVNQEIQTIEDLSQPVRSEIEELSSDLENEKNAIRESFDENYYLAKYVDVEKAGVDALEHYCLAGWREGRNPTSDFSTAYYIDSNPDVAAANINPFWHYIVAGRSEGRGAIHPGGYKAEILKYLPTVEFMINQWKRKDKPEENLTVDKLADQIEALDKVGIKLMLSIGQDNYKANAGGVQLCIKREEEISDKYGYTYMNISPWQPMPTLAKDSSSDILISLILNGTTLGVCGYEILQKALVKLLEKRIKNIEVVIHSLLGHSINKVVELVKLTKDKNCIFWLHDFLSLCPNYALQRNSITFCGAPSIQSNACQICVFGEERLNHLMQIKDLFNKLKISIVSPSQAALDFWVSKNNLKPFSMTVLPHVAVQERQKNKTNNLNFNAPIVIAYMGYPAAHKGWNFFEETVKKYADDKRLKFIYFGTQKPSLRNLNYIQTHTSPGRYSDIVQTIKEQHVDYLMHWASCFETFSFTAHEAIAAGSLVITNNQSGNVSAVAKKINPELVFNSRIEFFNFVESEKLISIAIAQRKLMANLEFELVMSDMTYEILRN
jgi:hypothetical protein